MYFVLVTTACMQALVRCELQSLQLLLWRSDAWTCIHPPSLLLLLLLLLLHNSSPVRSRTEPTTCTYSSLSSHPVTLAPLLPHQASSHTAKQRQ